MRKLLLVVLCVSALAWGQEKADDNAPALTIYNGNFFVARERFPLDLKSGVNHAEYAGIAAHLLHLLRTAKRKTGLSSRFLRTVTLGDQVTRM